MRPNCVMAKDSAGTTNTLALAQDERCAVGGQTRIGGFQSAGPLTLVEGNMSGSGGDAWSTGGPPRGSKRSNEAASQAKASERGARVIEVLRRGRTEANKACGDSHEDGDREACRKRRR
jgi:hypothetical protein